MNVDKGTVAIHHRVSTIMELTLKLDFFQILDIHVVASITPLHVEGHCADSIFYTSICP